MGYKNNPPNADRQDFMAIMAGTATQETIHSQLHLTEVYELNKTRYIPRYARSHSPHIVF